MNKTGFYNELDKKPHNENLRRLLDFYGRLTEHMGEITDHEVFSCDSCKKCCCYPYFYMSLYQSEYELIDAYMKTENISIKARFDRMESEGTDKRIFYRNWICPLYDHYRGRCSVYPVRPLSCRVFGPYTTEAGRIEGCVFTNPVIYVKPRDLPFWEEFQEILRDYENNERGYILPDSMFYQYPAVEMLMNMTLPWSLFTNSRMPPYDICNFRIYNSLGR